MQACRSEAQELLPTMQLLRSLIRSNALCQVRNALMVMQWRIMYFRRSLTLKNSLIIQ